MHMPELKLFVGQVARGGAGGVGAETHIDVPITAAGTVHALVYWSRPPDHPRFEPRGNTLKDVKNFGLKMAPAKARIWF